MASKGGIAAKPPREAVSATDIVCDLRSLVGICSAKWTKTAAERFHVRSLHRRRDAVECLDAAECHIKQPQGPANGHGTLHECCQSICHDAGTSEQILYLGTRIVELMKSHELFVLFRTEGWPGCTSLPCTLGFSQTKPKLDSCTRSPDYVWSLQVTASPTGPPQSVQLACL